MANAPLSSDSPGGPRRGFLPRLGSPAYHLLLSAVAILILGPLGGLSAAFMNFSIGFFVGGQVLAGILGSVVTLPYGPAGKHGANYMQTMAASVAGMCGMAVLVQAGVWLGLPETPAWQLMLYFLCIGMFGVGVGMLYTPLLVDRMQLTYPSGLAVANILRALTDPALLRRSIGQLSGGTVAGYGVGLASLLVDRLGATGLSVSTIGAGIIVGSRIAIPALVVGLIGLWQTPHLVAIGWLKPGESFRKIGFLIALGTILGAALLDIILILIQAARQWRERQAAPVVAAAAAADDWRQVNLYRLLAWTLFWAAGTIFVGAWFLHQPIFYLSVAVGLCFLFVLINGISQGISDWNPISSAFVVTVFILAALGLRDAGTGLLCGAILLVACSEGCDMQQDRSTGWRLGTNRVVQFRYQVIGIIMGAVLAVALAKLFMGAYPVLRIDQFAHQNAPGTEKWQSTMTFKFVGALRAITAPKPFFMTAIQMGIAIGLATEIARKGIKRLPGYGRFATGSAGGRTVDFLLDAVLLPSPYASSFGGFAEMPTILWWTLGGLLGSGLEAVQKWRARTRPAAGGEELPADMSTCSLLGGGLVAGDALAALSVGLYGMIRTLF